MSDAEFGREFIDSNMLVYGHSPASGEKRQRASNLLDRLWESEGGCLSIQVLQETFVTLTRKVPRPLPVAEAARIVEEYGRWTVHSPLASDVLRAIELATALRISFWDAMILQSARRTGCRILWTEDLSHGQTYEGVTVRNPFA